MKKSIVFLAAVTLSTAVVAGNMPNESRSGNHEHGDMKSMQENMSSMHNSMNKDTTQTDILKNKEMQRLHEEMKLNGLSEQGMEARRMMIGTEAGEAYHKAVDQDRKNTAG
ncbi:MAG: hypothetical protein COB25_014850 [Oceanospirillales bacterium]|jgi:hypothetical protein|uniref:hypothetical protein n=1 Tax=Marinobacter maritimus TaxID=277961 RepID=UPI000BD2ABFF|nr:hypothetical protein [Marinobacter maritimus]MBL1273723.1 hypothetical protein [Oceanospirillales bacterium]|tara:strand:- start:2548 stop:2880 length:333 start_codon:yes stop_codon:yes gene_type:complete